jgi:hypothetical protein
MQQTVGGQTNFGPPSQGNATGTGQGGWQFGQHRHLLDSLASVGGSGAHENRPSFLGVIWIMKVRNFG